MWGRVLDSDVVGAAGDVLVSPLDHQNVLSLLFELVADVVQAVAQMFHYDLLARDLGTVHTNKEHVTTCRDTEQRVGSIPTTHHFPHPTSQFLSSIRSEIGTLFCKC